MKYLLLNQSVVLGCSPWPNPHEWFVHGEDVGRRQPWKWQLSLWWSLLTSCGCFRAPWSIWKWTRRRGEQRLKEPWNLPECSLHWVSPWEQGDSEKYSMRSKLESICSSISRLQCPIVIVGNRYCNFNVESVCHRTNIVPEQSLSQKYLGACFVCLRKRARRLNFCGVSILATWDKIGTGYLFSKLTADQGEILYCMIQAGAPTSVSATLTSPFATTALPPPMSDPDDIHSDDLDYETDGPLSPEPFPSPFQVPRNQQFTWPPSGDAFAAFGSDVKASESDFGAETQGVHCNSTNDKLEWEAMDEE